MLKHNETKKAVLQIFTGGYKEEPPCFEDIKETLLPLLDQIPVEKIIMGWSVQAEVYRRTIELAGEYGTKVYLWLPVFSETGLLKPVQRLLDDEGFEVKSYQLKEGENFEFYCPNESVNLKSFMEIYEERFADIPFDGVFLDKIRYGAFSNGRNGVFSCFCKTCQAEYEKAGIDTAMLQKEMMLVKAKDLAYQEAPLGITGYEKGRYHFRSTVWEKFFSYKSKRICEALKPVIEEFHQKGMDVGIDTFSPFTAYFAGQDIERLGQMADFVKPMMYRITNAPAGLPWESESLLKETLSQDITYESAKKRFFEIIGCREQKEAFDLEFAKKELAFLAHAGVKLYPGIEINRIAGVADTTPDYIRENVEAFSKLPIEGFVLAWDLLSAPSENLEEVIRIFG